MERRIACMIRLLLRASSADFMQLAGLNVKGYLLGIF